MKYAFFVFLLLGLPQVVFAEEASKTPPLEELKAETVECQTPLPGELKAETIECVVDIGGSYVPRASELAVSTGEVQAETPPSESQNKEIIKLLREIRAALVEFQVERRTQQEKPQRIVDPDSCVLIDGAYAQTHFYICWGTQYKHWP